jgi:hypothetical protein
VDVPAAEVSSCLGLSSNWWLGAANAETVRIVPEPGPVTSSYASIGACSLEFAKDGAKSWVLLSLSAQQPGVAAGEPTAQVGWCEDRTEAGGTRVTSGGVSTLVIPSSRYGSSGSSQLVNKLTQAWKGHVGCSDPKQRPVGKSEASPKGWQTTDVPTILTIERIVVNSTGTATAVLSVFFSDNSSARLWADSMPPERVRVAGRVLSTGS